MSPTEEAAVKRVIERGERLFEVDRAAWITTDDMIEKLGGDAGAPIKGWVVEPDATTVHAYVVTYFADGPSGPVAWYVGHMRNNKLVSGELLPASSRPALSAAQIRIARAVEAARAQSGYRPCTAARFNIDAIAPDAPDGPVDVYLLTAMVENGEYPFGGHFLLRVASDGKTVSSRKFTNTCLNIREPVGANGEKPVALGVTHILDPVPTEIHVFLSIWTGKPIFVRTQKRAWLVDGPKIGLIGN
ncbi:MAG TPA: hypothetical protein VGD66_02770 [Allosphingosinicella sp.]|jgi:hypothetical protein